MKDKDISSEFDELWKTIVFPGRTPVKGGTILISDDDKLSHTPNYSCYNRNPYYVFESE